MLEEELGLGEDEVKMGLTECEVYAELTHGGGEDCECSAITQGE